MKIPYIPELPMWLLPLGVIIVGIVLIIVFLVFFVELNMSIDCEAIGTGESDMTEEEAVQMREACVGFGDSGYLFVFVIMPIMAVVMFLTIILPIIKADKEDKTP